jgi:hypothetical protein
LLMTLDHFGEFVDGCIDAGVMLVEIVGLVVALVGDVLSMSTRLDVDIA